MPMIPAGTMITEEPEELMEISGKQAATRGNMPGNTFKLVMMKCPSVGPE
jgi:hypothetical protein